MPFLDLFPPYGHFVAISDGRPRVCHCTVQAMSNEQHFSALSTGLIGMAKEADRDVWEQRNNQFSQMLVCAVLMFGVTFGNINEGTYKFSKDDDLLGGELSSLWCSDGMFVLLTGTSISSLFVCIASCLMVMRRMSSYMIERSSNLVDRLSVSTGLAHQISGTAQEGHSGPELERVLMEERGRFHAKMGAVIGTGPKEASRRNSKDTVVEPGSLSTSVLEQLNGGFSEGKKTAQRWSSRGGMRSSGVSICEPDSSEDSSSAYHEFVDQPRRPPPSLRPLHTTDRQMSFRTRSRQAPLNFSIFYRTHCQWLSLLVLWSFVTGVLTAWASLGLLVWNQFPHLIVPICGFAVVGLISLATAAHLERRTRLADKVTAGLLRDEGLCTPAAMPPPSPERRPTPPSARPPAMATRREPSPPPSPPPALAYSALGVADHRDDHAAGTRAEPSLAHEWVAASMGSQPAHAPLLPFARAADFAPAAPRLRQLGALRDEGLITTEEFLAKRAAILETL